MPQAVVIKSKSYGMHLVLNPKLAFAQLLEAVIDKFQESGMFFKDAKIGISFEGPELSFEQEYELIAAIEGHSTIQIVCVMEQGEIREACVLADTEAIIREKVSNHAVFHYGSLNPGDDLRFDTGVVITGNVPKGAKVRAGGNIIVFGVLDGFAHAGAYDGDSAACIAALSIDTGQLQIGSILFMPQEKEGKNKKNKGGLFKKKKPEETFSPQIARVQNGHVIMEPCTKDLFQFS